MGRQAIDLTGQRFGMLVAQSYTAGQWSCRCDCGTVLDVEALRLRRESVLDCGCLAEVSRRELIEGMVAQRELIAQLEAEQTVEITSAEQAQEIASAGLRSSRRAPVPTRNVSPAAGRLDPVQYALRKVRAERQAAPLGIA